MSATLPQDEQYEKLLSDIRLIIREELDNANNVAPLDMTVTVPVQLHATDLARVIRLNTDHEGRPSPPTE